MRLIGLIAGFVSLFVAGSACAQDWDIYVNRDNFFSVNLPNDPVMTQAPYKTRKGADLTAHIFTAMAPAGTILSGAYKVTVVDYSNAKDELSTAVDQAAEAIKARGATKYDGLNNIDLHASRRLTVETANTRILAEILVAANNRLYITEAETPRNVPPPDNFQASLQILDDKGTRIRTRTLLGLPEGEVPQISAGGVPEESDKIAQMMSGTWRAPNGSCQAAYFKSGERVKTSRGENALSGTVVNSGVTFTGQLILNGSREGQFIDPKTDKAVMLFDTKNGEKLNVAAIDAPAIGWPDVTLDLCPGSRG